MKDKLKIIKESAEIPENYKYYWGYQYELGKQVIVPYLKNMGIFNSNCNVAEIGSAEGGVLAALSDAGADKLLGTDIALDRLEIGEKISKLGSFNISFSEHNIIIEKPMEEWIEAYDLVILRDVIEHLDDTTIALTNIKKIIKKGGYLYVTFPPYYSAFGGHQHTLANFWGKIPYIHYLPDRLFHKMISSGRSNDIEEVKRLQKIRLTTKKFIDASILAGYEIYRFDYYLLRPVYKMKFGLPSLKITALHSLPLIKDFFSMEASFVLRKL